MVSAPQRRRGVEFLMHKKLSERRACHLVGIKRSSFRYVSRSKDNAELMERLKHIARNHPRYGYRRAWALERRAGRIVNHKKIFRLWRALGLSLPKRKPRKRHRKMNEVPVKAIYPNNVWTYDFVFDRCENGQQLKILTIEDEFTREGIEIAVDHRMPSKQVVEILE